MATINSVMQRLESGKASVKGMKMLYPVTDASLFRVIVKGISFSQDGCRCGGGPELVISPIDGVGDMCVPVGKLVDDTKESRDRYFRQHQAEVWRRERHVHSMGIVSLRHEVNKLLAEFGEKKRAHFMADAGFKLTENGTADGKLNQYELNRLLNHLVDAKFGVSVD